MRHLSKPSVRFHGIAAALVCAALGALIASASAGTNISSGDPRPTSLRSGVSQSNIDDYLDESPGIPLVVPKDLPTGYRWSGPAFMAKRAEGSVYARSSILVGMPADSRPTIEICAQLPGSDVCPAGDSQVRRDIGGADVRIIFRGAGSSAADLHEFWENVNLSSNRRITWLPN